MQATSSPRTEDPQPSPSSPSPSSPSRSNNTPNRTPRKRDESTGQVPFKDVLQRHNEIMENIERKNRAREKEKKRGSVASPPPTPAKRSTNNADAASVTTGHSVWDDATPEMCMAYISKPHVSWRSAVKGIDITDVCPTWKRQKSEYTPSAASQSEAASVASPSAASVASSSRSRVTTGSTARRGVAPRAGSNDFASPIKGLAVGSVGLPSNGLRRGSNASESSAGTPSGRSGVVRKATQNRPPLKGYSDTTPTVMYVREEVLCGRVCVVSVAFCTQLHLLRSGDKAQRGSGSSHKGR